MPCPTQHTKSLTHSLHEWMSCPNTIQLYNQFNSILYKYIQMPCPTQHTKSLTNSIDLDATSYTIP